MRGLIMLPLSLLTERALPLTFSKVFVNSLEGDMALLQSRIEAYKTGLSLIPSSARDSPDIRYLDNCFKTLENVLLVRASEEARQMFEGIKDRFCKQLVMVCTYCEVNMSQKNESISDSIKICTSQSRLIAWYLMKALVYTKCLTSALRLMIGLSADKDWSETLLSYSGTLMMVFRVAVLGQRTSSNSARGKQPEDTGTEFESSGLDILCYTLAILSHLLQAKADSIDLLDISELGQVVYCRYSLMNVTLPIAFASGCPRTRHCLTSCRCSDKQNTLDYLVGLYRAQSKRSHDLVSTRRWL